MAFRLGDRARETSTAPGTGSFTVNGAVQGAQSLASVLTANADTSWYFATNGTAWEVGLLTRTSATVYARAATPFASSNAGALVNFSSGLVDISLDLPASVIDTLNLTEITVTSATTTDIGAVQGAKILISGTTTITGLGTSTNKLRFVRFSGALTLTHNGTSLILPGAANILTVAGDTAIFTSDSSGNWRCHDYQPSSGYPLNGVRSKLITVTRNMATATGSVAYTGVGFKPSALIVYGAIATTIAQTIGASDSALNQGGNAWLSSTYINQGAQPFLIYIPDGTGANYQQGAITSFDSDGFTISWTKGGTPTGSATFSTLCLR